MFTLAQLYCKNILPPVLCNYKIFLDCVSLQSLSPLPRVSWHGAAAVFGSQELAARAGSKMAAKRPREMSPGRPASPRLASRGGRRAAAAGPRSKRGSTFPTARGSVRHPASQSGLRRERQTKHPGDPPRRKGAPRGLPCISLRPRPRGPSPRERNPINFVGRSKIRTPHSGDMYSSKSMSQAHIFLFARA